MLKHDVILVVELFYWLLISGFLMVGLYKWQMNKVKKITKQYKEMVYHNEKEPLLQI